MTEVLSSNSSEFAKKKIMIFVLYLVGHGDFLSGSSSFVSLSKSVFGRGFERANWGVVLENT